MSTAFISLGMIILGVLGLVLAGEIAVAGSRALARQLRVSPMTIGVTIAAFGTSLPEIATNLAVAVHARAGTEASGIAVGNIVGSCLSQATLLLGVTALVGVLRIGREGSWRDGGMVIVALALMWLTAVDGVTQRWEGAVLVAVYVAYLASVWMTGRRTTATKPEPGSTRTLVAVGQTLGGAVGLVVAAELLMRGSIDVIARFGVEETWLGLMLGLGTGLPELVLAVQAVRQGLAGLAVGNLLGSNITDPLASYGLGASLYPVEVAPEILRVDFPAWLIATAASLFLLAGPAGLTRVRAAVLIAMFAGYLVVRWVVL